VVSHIACVSVLGRTDGNGLVLGTLFDLNQLLVLHDVMDHDGKDAPERSREWNAIEHL
jgi:hypothetical protein